MDRMQLQNIMKEKGIVGAGGAGFPTYEKLDDRAKTIILNCAECEPLLYLHRQLLEKHTYEIIDAFGMIANALGSTKIIIAIKKAYKDTIEAVSNYLNLYKNMSICPLDEVYPVGDEIVLIYETTGVVIPIGKLPIDSGIAVFNVETVYNIYRSVRLNEAVTDKLVTIVGEVENPITVRVPIGIEVKEVVKFAGKTLIEDPCYFMGGSMMGQMVGKKSVITKTSNGILVLPKDHILIRKQERNSSIDIKRAAAACCQCSMCTDLCPRNLLGHPVEPHLFMLAATCKDVQKTEAYINTLFCSSCGLCEMYSCVQGLSPRTLMKEYQQGLKQVGISKQYCVTNHFVRQNPVNQKRKYRKVPMERLLARLGLTKYKEKAILVDEVKETNRVKLLLNQSGGTPAIGIVKQGDLVNKGQMIGRAQQGLSVSIHGSISGKVIEANDQYIVIEKLKGWESNE